MPPRQCPSIAIILGYPHWGHYLTCPPESSSVPPFSLSREGQILTFRLADGYEPCVSQSIIVHWRAFVSDAVAKAGAGATILPAGAGYPCTAPAQIDECREERQARMLRSLAYPLGEEAEWRACNRLIRHPAVLPNDSREGALPQPPNRISS